MMSPKRVLLVGLLVGALALVVGAGFVYMTLAGVGEGVRLYVLEGLLGPEDQRRRVELPEHGISVAMPRGWAMECPRSGLDQDVGTGLSTIAVLEPDLEGATCMLLRAEDVGPALRRGDQAADTEEQQREARRIVQPWLERHDLGDECASPSGGFWGAGPGVACDGGPGSTGAAWVFPQGEGGLVLGCTWRGNASDLPDRAPWSESQMLLSAMAVMAGAIEPLAEGERSEVACTGGARVALADSATTMVFPDDWRSVRPGSREHEEAFGSADPRGSSYDVEDMVTHTNSFWYAEDAIIVGLHDSGEGSSPLEACMLAETQLAPDWLVRAEGVSAWDLEGLLFPTHEGAPELEPIELPAGKALRATVGEGPAAVEYMLASADPEGDLIVHRLLCTGVEPAEDGWRSIAETLRISTTRPWDGW